MPRILLDDASILNARQLRDTAMRKICDWESCDSNNAHRVIKKIFFRLSPKRKNVAFYASYLQSSSVSGNTKNYFPGVEESILDLLQGLNSPHGHTIYKALCAKYFNGRRINDWTASDDASEQS